MSSSNKAFHSVDTVTFGLGSSPLKPVSLPYNLPAIGSISISALEELKGQAVGLLAGAQVSSRVKPKEDYEIQDRAEIGIMKPGLTEENLRGAYGAGVEATKNKLGGSSGTTMLIMPGRVLVAWMGDSPAFLAGVNPGTGKIEDIIGLNEPHIPFNEEAELVERGGKLDDLKRLDNLEPSHDQENEYPLSMSRAFGNAWLPPLIREPGIVHYDTTQLSDKLDWYGVVASDGVLMESEADLMFPPKHNRKMMQDSELRAKFGHKGLIDYCAYLFQQLVNDDCKPWKPENGNWAENVTKVSQDNLKMMEANEKLDPVTNKKRIGYAAVDDTTLLIEPIPQKGTKFPTIVMTVTDGHRRKGEETAAEALKAIHLFLATC